MYPRWFPRASSMMDHRSVHTDSHTSDTEKALEALLVRMRQRQYPDTTPVLASCWLSTVWAGNHSLRWWNRLNDLLGCTLREESLNRFSYQAIVDIQSWVQQSVLATGQTGPSQHPRRIAASTTLDSRWIAPYAARLLNEWMPAEVARIQMNARESVPGDGGTSSLAIERAIENLLLRTRLSAETLEMLLRPGLFSPQYVYPADTEILRDVALSLLERIESPPQPLMPASLVCVAWNSSLGADYETAVAQASLIAGPDGEEIHVPIEASKVPGIMRGEQVRLGSVIVTMDGRWWESRSFQGGQRNAVIYVPAGRLKIDYSADHAKLVIPWPEIRRQWNGEVVFPRSLVIFGREWHPAELEQDGEHAWLHLGYSRTVKMVEIAPAAAAGLRRVRPAAVDIAWSALENALAASMKGKSIEPIEELSHGELIPLGRSLYALIQSAKGHHWGMGASIEAHLRPVRYFAGEIPSEYGLVPWRILPAPVRSALWRHCRRELPEVFEGTGLLGRPTDLKSAPISHAILPSKAA